MFSIQKIGIPVVRRTAKGKTSDPFTVHAVRAYLYDYACRLLKQEVLLSLPQRERISFVGTSKRLQKVGLRFNYNC